MNVMSGSPLAIVIAIVCAVVLLRLITGLASGSNSPSLDPVAKPLLTPRESAALDTLERILPAHRIHAQVSMGALLQAPRRPGSRATPINRNSFAQKIVDFVVQDRATGSVVALIEVDDPSHNAARDAKRDAMTVKAGYTTIRIPARSKLSIAEVRLALAPLLASNCADLPPTMTPKRS